MTDALELFTDVQFGGIEVNLIPSPSCGEFKRARAAARDQAPAGTPRAWLHRSLTGRIQVMLDGF